MLISAMLFQPGVSKVRQLMQGYEHLAVQNWRQRPPPVYLACGRALQGTLFSFHDVCPKAAVLLELMPSNEQKERGLF